MINKNKINLKGRREKIVDNISKLLNEHNIKQKKFCEDLGYDPSTLSKWKNGTSSPSIEMIDAIANYFNVEAHQIYYTSEELEKIAIKSSGTYNPNDIKENVIVHDYSDLFTPWFGFIVPVAAIVLFIYFLWISKNETTSLIFAMSCLILLSILLKVAISPKHRFVINYLDEIYHKIDNKNFKHSSISKIFGAFFIVLLILSAIQALYEFSSSLSLGIYLILSVLSLIFSFVYIIGIEKSMSDRQYDDGFFSAKAVMISIIISSCLLMLSVYTYIFEDTTIWMILVNALMCVINSIVYFLYIKKCQEYYLVIEDENGKTSKLELK